MVEQNKDSKSKDKRLEEKERIEAEIVRSHAVERMKQAHKAIEHAEKLRKRSAVISVNERLQAHVKSVHAYVQILMNMTKANQPADEIVRGNVERILRTYESIRYDLRKILDTKDEDFEKLFPKLEVRLTTTSSVVFDLLGVAEQETDMVTYLIRMFI